MFLDGPWQSCVLVHGLSPSECASWVQAWGSIMAIVASVALVYLARRMQDQRDREQRKNVRVGRLEVLFKLIDSTVNRVGYVQDHLSDKSRLQAARYGRPNIDMDAVETLGDLLAPIPLHELDDPEVAFEILLLGKNAKQLKELALMAIKLVDGMPEVDITKALQSMKAVRDQADRNRTEVRARIEAIKSLGA